MGLPAFRRIVWAPKIMADTAEAADPSLRDPLAVLARFGEQLDNDIIESDNLSRFIDFLIRHLDKTEPRRPDAKSSVGPGAQIYLEHDEGDIAYVDELAGALKKRSLTPIIPVLQGSPAKRSAYNRNKMRNCDAVALCWGSASEVWAMSAASRLDQWRRRERKERLALLAAPPHDKLKERRVRIKPPEVDVVVDLTHCEKPSPKDLDPWLGPLTSIAAAPKSG
jgi:hypothetical protein